MVLRPLTPLHRCRSLVAYVDASIHLTEIVMGRVVGRGGFSVVNEVANIRLQEVYDMSNDGAKARAEIAASCHNDDAGTNRYVVKMLRSDLPEDEHTKGVVDLAVEARFLAMLSHPNIISMRATANSDPLESKYFVVLDRLVNTLEFKMQSWRREIGGAMGFWFGPCIGHCCANKNVLHKLWIDRLLVARDIAAAVRYLHAQDIVYRDMVSSLSWDSAGASLSAGGVLSIDPDLCSVGIIAAPSERRSS